MRTKYVFTVFSDMYGKRQFPVTVECKAKSKKWGWVVLVRFPTGYTQWIFLDAFKGFVVEPVRMCSIPTIKSFQ